MRVQDSDIKVDVDRSVLDAILKKIKEKEDAEAGDSTPLLSHTFIVTPLFTVLYGDVPLF